MVLLAKIIPSQIETSMFAFFMGIINLFGLVIAKFIGNAYNKTFIGVTSENLDNLWKLYTIQISLSILPIFLVWILPTKKAVGAI